MAAKSLLGTCPMDRLDVGEFQLVKRARERLAGQRDSRVCLSNDLEQVDEAQTDAIPVVSRGRSDHVEEASERILNLTAGNIEVSDRELRIDI